MNPLRIYGRDVLGLAVVGMFILATLGVIFSLVSLLFYVSGDTALALDEMKLAAAHLLFVIPAMIIGTLINRPEWLEETANFRLDKAKKESK